MIAESSPDKTRPSAHPPELSSSKTNAVSTEIEPGLECRMENAKL
jgi:hypothetical protein